MLRVRPGSSHPLHSVAATRQAEVAASQSLPPHTLMQRAGRSVARLARAVAPHARHIWVACGPGNNGGDGLEAAAQLRLAGCDPVVTLFGDAARRPDDARAALERARAAGVRFASAPPEHHDLAIDALLGLGADRAPYAEMADWIDRLNTAGAPVLAIDCPSALNVDTGLRAGGAASRLVIARHTLALIALHPGLFMGEGRDAAGTIWFDALDVPVTAAPVASLSPPPEATTRAHASHKGSYGDVAVVGGAPGMKGAPLLAATAALHAGAGRVFVSLLGPDPGFDASVPELMFRAPSTLDFAHLTLACGCGGGDAVRTVLARALSSARALVVDADGLNAVSTDAQLRAQLTARGRAQRPTVLTPHPLEAARLLGGSAAQVQADRLRAAQQLAREFGAVVALKGSGTVIARPDGMPFVNPTGNARLAIAGTGDVLAGMIAARLARAEPAFRATCDAVYLHGEIADRWPADRSLTASRLARAQA